MVGCQRLMRQVSEAAVADRRPVRVLAIAAPPFTHYAGREGCLDPGAEVLLLQHILAFLGLRMNLTLIRSDHDATLRNVVRMYKGQADILIPAFSKSYVEYNAQSLGGVNENYTFAATFRDGIIILSRKTDIPNSKYLLYSTMDFGVWIILFSFYIVIKVVKFALSSNHRIRKYLRFVLWTWYLVVTIILTVYANYLAIFLQGNLESKKLFKTTKDLFQLLASEKCRVAQYGDTSMVSLLAGMTFTAANPNVSYIITDPAFLKYSIKLTKEAKRFFYAPSMVAHIRSSSACVIGIVRSSVQEYLADFARGVDIHTILMNEGFHDGVTSLNVYGWLVAEGVAGLSEALRRMLAYTDFGALHSRFLRDHLLSHSLSLSPSAPPPDPTHSLCLTQLLDLFILSAAAAVFAAAMAVVERLAACRGHSFTFSH